MMDYDYDLFVIGGGSGGVRAARLAASEAGVKVALAEEFRMGGTCVIRGCVPKKLMVYGSKFGNLVKEAKDYGWDVKNGGFSWPEFQKKLRAELSRLEKAYRTGLDKAGVRIFDMRAKLEGPNTISLDDGSKLTARYILIATGGTPSIPDLPGAEYAITSNEIFDLPALPKSILIVGGGDIACDFSCILNGMGVDVTHIYRGKQILRRIDSELTGILMREMRRKGIQLLTQTNVTGIEKTAQGLVVTLTSGETRVFDAVFFATGRAPNTQGLGLERAGIALGPKGEIPVDSWSKTAMGSVYAVGDVTDRIALTPVAIREGAAFVDTVFHKRPHAFDHNLVPRAVFSQPEIGTVGLSETEAAAQEAVDIYTTQFSPMRQSFSDEKGCVFMKLVVSRTSQKILGCHILGDHGAELIQIAAIAVNMGATKAQFDATCAVHPTTAEELVTLKKPVRRLERAP